MGRNKKGIIFNSSKYKGGGGGEKIIFIAGFGKRRGFCKWGYFLPKKGGRNC